MKRKEEKKQKREKAIERQNVRNSRPVSAQIEALDRRLGTGIGAKKERARLEKELAGV